MADKNKTPSFLVGQAGKREVKKLLLRSTNPAATITNFQKTRSLHSMFARAFGTTPRPDGDQAAEDSSSADAAAPPVESLDTDSVLTFLGHLGVTRFEVHKRIQDSLQKQLEEEIRKIGPGSQEPLLNLLKNCWHPATTVPELRPILWAVLKQLGEQTPLAVLNALGERESPDSQQLKHAEIFRPLPPLLKRLVWEADWDEKVPVSKEVTVNNPKEYLTLVQSTLLHGTVQPLVDKYCSTGALVESAEKFFVTSALERRVLTTQRRALTSTSTTNSAGVSAVTAITTTALLGKTAAAASGSSQASSSPSEPLLNSGRAVSQLRQLLGDTAGGTASYRPKLLHALLSMLMAHHGTQAPKTLTGTHLHCTLVADILLSAGGPLPKIYAHVHTLARILDDSVKHGVFSDKDLIKVQEILKNIYAAEHAEQDDSDNATGKTQKTATKKKEEPENATAKADETKPTTFLKRQLNRIITAGLQAMKESDPQNLFLNPVTDAIAPGYSKVIKKPMSISTMETKIENNVYNSIEEWSSDVKLMFKNCADYNRGKAGQWFRGEAGRQLKVFKDEIVPQAKRLYLAELKKRNPDDEDMKRKREDEPKVPEIAPLPAVAKKRKIEAQEYTLSMPALASMLLADPFVVRLLLDRVLRSLRIDVLRGSSIPAAHTVIPSLLQLLHMAKWSTQICAARGRRYLVPDSGLEAPEAIDALEAMIPFDSLRRYLPILMHLSLDAELDKRVAVGGDLNSVADSLPRTPAPTVELKKDSPPYQVSVALLEGLFIHVCLPGNSQDTSLAGTFLKFSKTLQELAGTIWDEHSFFVCLVPTILKYKARLNRTVRDTIISTWTEWLSTTDFNDGSSKKKKRKGSMTSAGHEYLVLLFNEWASFGNLLLPRDLLLKVSLELVEAVNKTETTTERQFLKLWKAEDAKDFEPIKKQYEKMLSLLPENHRSQWKTTVGIIEKPAPDEVEEPKVESAPKSPEPMETDADKEKEDDKMEEN